MITVGYDQTNYSSRRNIFGLPFTQVTMKRAPNFFRGPNYLYYKILRDVNPYLQNLHYCTKGANIDVLHLFNAIHLGKKPWLVTFETMLPRWVAYGKGHAEWGLKYVARNNCKRIIGFSECSKHIFLDFLQGYPKQAAFIQNKIEVLLPPQKPLINSPEEKQPNAQPHFMIVGTDFFRKGGLPTLRAFERLWKMGADAKLIIVSSLQAGDYASKAGKEEIAEAHAIMERNKENIIFHPGLPSSQVMDLFLKADVGLLPTFADTFGYSVLEAQAAGCPVISTDVRALPEVNNNEVGWMFEVPKDHWRNARLDTHLEIKEVAKVIEENLVVTLSSILNDPQVIRQKAVKAIAQLKQNHDPDRHVAVLEKYYAEALK